jgi:hypothetical protein
MVLALYLLILNKDMQKHEFPFFSLKDDYEILIFGITWSFFVFHNLI